MFAKQSHSYTPAEYLALEEKAEYKSEYFQGKIVAMAPGADLPAGQLGRSSSRLGDWFIIGRLVPEIGIV